MTVYVRQGRNAFVTASYPFIRSPRAVLSLIWQLLFCENSTYSEVIGKVLGGSAITQLISQCGLLGGWQLCFRRIQYALGYLGGVTGQLLLDENARLDGPGPDIGIGDLLQRVREDVSEHDPDRLADFRLLLRGKILVRDQVRVHLQLRVPVRVPFPFSLCHPV